MNWQPIDTVPKDGTPVLLFLTDGNVAKARHDFGGYSQEEYVANNWGYREAWSIMGVESYEYVWLSSEPTHWMPLPEPPK